MKLVQLETNGKCIYTVGYGCWERVDDGPFIGEPNLNLNVLLERCREALYAQANAEKKDECYFNENEFLGWLIKEGYLKRIETTHLELDVSTSHHQEYAPSHWPLCPNCEEGRGKKTYGDARRSLNRIDFFYSCTKCWSHWGHSEEPYDESKPMIEDDGRDTAGGCVPFAISKATGLPWGQVLKVCKQHGWSSTGMHTNKAIVAARELGFELVLRASYDAGESNRPTIKRMIRELSPNSNYIIGVKNHWVAWVQGEMVDNDSNGTENRKVLALYEVEPC